MSKLERSFWELPMDNLTTGGYLRNIILAILFGVLISWWWL